MQDSKRKHHIKDKIVTLEVLKGLESIDIIDSDTLIKVDRRVNLNEIAYLRRIPYKFTKCFDVFNVSRSNLVTLENSPNQVMSDYLCSLNQIKTLCGGPQHVQGTYDASFNQLKSFEGFPEYVTSFDLTGCGFTSLEGISKSNLKHCVRFSICGNDIQSGGIGLIFIPCLVNVNATNTNVDFHNAMQIIKNYFRTGKAGLLSCQEALCEAGLEEYARL